MARRRSKRQVAAETSTVEVATWPQGLSTIDLVAEPGRVKHIHFDAGGRLVTSVAVPAQETLAPAVPAAESPPLPVALSTAPAPPTRRWRLRRKVYETERGNQVLAEEVDGERRFLVTSPHGERPFRPEEDVDPLIAGVPLEERRVVETVESVAQPAAGRTTFAEAVRAVPRAGAEGVYRLVVPAGPAPPAPPTPPDAADAWEPDGSAAPLREATRPAAPRKASRRARPARKVSRKKAARKASKRRPYTDFPGDDHLVLDIEGIGPVYAKRLQRQGVHTTGRLCYEKAASLARRVKAPAATVQKWKAMAELLKVKGIGPQYAEALARAGIGGIDELKAKKARKLAKRINAYLDSLEVNVLGTGVNEKRVARWQKAARRLRRRALPVPPKGPPLTDTVRGHIEVLRKVGARPARKASRRPSRT